ncbi:MAG: hypothetical protein SPL19_06190 [Fibrobacter sp.]|nr:hypothetical protein [Fibrobacter sp.]MDY6389931.1 hypothetical protein [Fibrobacter sp.]
MEIATLCISLLSFFAALAAVIVPIVIFKKQRKYDEEAERKRDEKERLAEQRCIEREQQAEQNRIKSELRDLQDELVSLDSRSSFPMSENERAIYSRKAYLNKRIERLSRK